jgi:hypothetical protein
MVLCNKRALFTNGQIISVLKLLIPVLLFYYILYFTIIIVYWFDFMVLNPTFNNISVISWWSVLLVEETGVPRENH